MQRCHLYPPGLQVAISLQKITTDLKKLNPKTEMMTHQGIVISMSRVSDFVDDQKEKWKIHDNSIILYKPLIYQVMYNTKINKKYNIICQITRSKSQHRTIMCFKRCDGKPDCKDREDEQVRQNVDNLTYFFHVIYKPSLK